ncbi:MAG: alpha/beta hydrolase [Pseudomonadota bacterium]|nr:alpha/beta hydrolase [Pseudomonadota bacterium]
MKFILIPVISVAIFFVIAFALILSQPPKGFSSDQTLDFPTGGSSAEVSELETFTARDGATLGYRDIAGTGAGDMLLVHGSGWHGAAYEPLARAISEQCGYRVIVPDLRGHGPLADPRGDVAYVGQMEDDLADLMDHLDLGDAVFAGHSSGGGLVIRFAGGEHASRMTRAVLIAPFLKYNAPTARETSVWAQPLTRRIVGLSMLNAVGIRALNGLTAIEFNLPPSVRETEQGQSATASYSYRLNTGYAPRSDYLADIAALPPFLLLAGSEDAAFRPDQYEPVMSGATDNGTYEILPGLGHLGVLDAPETTEAVARFLNCGP